MYNIKKLENLNQHNNQNDNQNNVLIQYKS